MSRLLENFRGVFEPDSPEARCVAQLSEDALPRHIAIIMDGNGRWANQRDMPRVEGHKAGIESVRNAIETCARLSIPVLTLYAFSAENWKRPVSEVNTLMELLQEYLRKELATLEKNNISFRAVGRLSDLRRSIQRGLHHVERVTRKNTGTQLVVALNYSGRLELVDAFNALLRQGAGAPVTEEDIERHLYTHGLPDPDLLIRTSGEMRISNFLLWQIAYAEIYVTDVLWPDFRALHLLEAILSFQRRERRYGGINGVSVPSTR